MVYHVLNRGNARSEVFHQDDDYAAFLKLLCQASDRLPMRLRVNLDRPFGVESWQKRTAKRLGLDHSMQPRGRLRKHLKK